MEKFSSFINEAKRSKIRPDAKHGDENGVNTKNDTVPTVNITDEKKYTVLKAIEEARAGRPKKNPTEEDPGSEHVVMQLRKVISTRGQHKVTHVSGEKTDVSPAHAHKMLAHHDNLKTSQEKHSYAARLHKSAASMRDAYAGKPEEKKAKISLAGKITGTQKEEVEQIDELSPATLGSYKSKAADSEKALTDKSSALNVPPKERNVAAVKANQRRQGMKLATNKLGEASFNSGVGGIRVKPVNMAGKIGGGKHTANAPASASSSEIESGQRVAALDRAAQDQKEKQKKDAQTALKTRTRATKLRQSIASGVRANNT
jgi:hypothetical protein